MLKQKKITSKQKILICKAVIEIVFKLSMRGIQHRDIKPENILMTHELKPKLADLGLMQLKSPYLKIPENCSEEQRNFLIKGLVESCSPDKFNEGVKGYNPPELELCTKLLSSFKANSGKLKRVSGSSKDDLVSSFKLKKIRPILSKSYKKKRYFCSGSSNYRCNYR